MPIVEAVAGPKLIDDRIRPDARPAVGPGDGLRFAIQPAKVDESGAAVAARGLERERVRIPPLPAHAREERIAAGQLVVDADVGPITVPLERYDFPEGAIAIRKRRLIRKRVEELQNLLGRRIDAIRRDAVTRKRRAGPRVPENEGRAREVAVPHRL